MTATDVLMEEHRLIERVITALEAGAQRLEDGEIVRPEFFLDASDFISGFADGCHRKKEEGVLFIAMASNGVPVQGGPIGVMLAEHEQGRIYNRGIRAGVVKLQAGDPKGKAEIIRNARNYAMLLRQHIAKEDTVLFPIAERFIPMEQLDRVKIDFETVEKEEIGEGVHERYHALAEALENEISAG